MNALDGKMPIKTEASSFSEAHHHDHKNLSAIPKLNNPPLNENTPWKLGKYEEVMSIQ